MEALVSRRITIASNLFVANEPERKEARLRTTLWECYVFCISRCLTRRGLRWRIFVKCIGGKSKEIALANLREFYESPYTIIVNEDRFDKYREAILQANRTQSDAKE